MKQETQASGFPSLTRRQRQVAQLLIEGHTTKSAANHLDVSPRTVEVYRSQLMKTLGVKTVSELIGLGMVFELPEGAIAKADARLAARARAQAKQTPDANAEYLLKMVLDALAGATVLHSVWAKGAMSDDYVGLMLRKRDGANVVMWIDRDPGANGPGWVRLEPA